MVKESSICSTLGMVEPDVRREDRGDLYLRFPRALRAGGADVFLHHLTPPARRLKRSKGGCVVATSTNSLIRVTDVCKEYNGGSVHALSHCNLSVKKGEVVAIIGPSGSGKSTLLRCLNLLEQPTSGTIYFKDVALNGKKVNLDLHRREMGMVFQHFNLFPHMTVKQNITLAPVKLGLKSQAEADAKTPWRCLSASGLPTRRTSIPRCSPAARSSVSPSCARSP